MTICVGPRLVSPPRTAPVRLTHVKCAPSPALAPFVAHYWVTRWDRRGYPPRVATSLLDPCVHLHVQDGRADVMGVVRGVYRVRLDDVGCVVGVKFRPGGFHPFVSRPVSAWTDRVVPVADVLGDPSAGEWAASLSREVAACDGGADEHGAIASAHLDAFLGAHAPARDAVAEQVADLVALVAARGDVRRVSDLARACGRSERTLHRLFDRYVGASPAWVIRRHRLHTAAARLTANPPADVRAVAWELGYADQAHFIRDFRATIGVTPGAYVQARG